MKTVDGDELINWWLTHYHGITIKDLVERHPDAIKTAAWFKLYPVTQQQHDEWEAWAKKRIREVTKYPKKLIEKSWWSVYLDCSPSVIQETTEP